MDGSFHPNPLGPAEASSRLRQIFILKAGTAYSGIGDERSPRHSLDGVASLSV